MTQYRYVIYARKSSEDSGRQILSIESQLEEMRQYAKREGLKINKEYTDAASAFKVNNRPDFNTMIQACEAGDIDGILVWKPDRLARNLIEGGAVQTLLQMGLIKEIRTPIAIHKSADHALILLVEMGCANQYSRDLSVNVKRGIRMKISRGGLCCRAPHGYINDRLNKTVYVDETRFSLIRMAWNLELTGNYSLSKICDVLNNELSFRTRETKKMPAKPLHIASLHAIFKNPFYYGLVQAGEHKAIGMHVPMVTKAEFEKVQELLARQGRQGADNQELPYTKLLACCECNASITGEHKVKYACPSCSKQNTAKHAKACPKCKQPLKQSVIADGHWYTYYHCTKKRGPCTQHSVSAKDLDDKFLELIDGIVIDKGILAWAIKWIKFVNQQNFGKREQEETRLSKQVLGIEQKLNSLIDMRAGHEISKEQFQEQKTTLEIQISRLRNLRDNSESHRNNWVKAVESEADFLEGLKKRFIDGGKDTKLLILRQIGSNYILQDGEVACTLEKRYLVLRKLTQFKNFQIEPGESQLERGLTPEKSNTILVWRP